MSAPPGFAPPYGAPAPTGGGGRRAARILGVAAGLLLVLSVTMTGLYVNKSSDLERTEKRLTAQISERDGTIAANQTEIDKLRAELQTVREKLADTEQDLTGTRNDRDEQARQKQIIATCLDKLTRALAAAATNNKAAYDKATQGLNKVCDEAENYL
jgi:chromosome segregation ATPase